MKLEILNASVVVLAKHHNPTILHPSFLASQGIVPEDWQLADPPVSTPVFALVKYENGIVFNVEENKFQVTDSQIKDDFAQSPVGNLAYKYVEKLPHVRYTAVGTNFHGFIEHSSPEKTLIDQFLIEGSADLDAAGPVALGLRLVYSAVEARLVLSIDAGKVKRGEVSPERSGILAKANYHTDLDDSNPIQGIRRAAELWGGRCDDFLDIMRHMFARRGTDND